MGLYKGGLYTGGLIHGRSFVLVINKSDINKSVINRGINVYYKQRLLGLYYLGDLYSGGLIFGWAYIRVGLYSGGAYIWNEVSISTCGGLIHGGGGLIFGGAYSRRFTVWHIAYISIARGFFYNYYYLILEEKNYIFEGVLIKIVI